MEGGATCRVFSYDHLEDAFISLVLFLNFHHQASASSHQNQIQPIDFEICITWQDVAAMVRHFSCRYLIRDFNGDITRVRSTGHLAAGNTEGG